MKLFFFIFCTINFTLNCQIIPVKLGCFPSEIKESSGIMIGENNTIWTHNDGKDKGLIYQLNSDLTIKKKLKILNSIDRDVEDITQDDSFIYINDMGNNSNERSDLRIYKIRKSEAYTQSEVKAEIIEFLYLDQATNPPSKDLMNFDCEAFFAFGDNLYLFSKNRGKSTYSNIYKVSKIPGIHFISPIDSIHTGFWVTSVAISPDRSKFAILSSGLVYIYSDLIDNQFSKAKMHRFTVPYTQKEGICFLNDSIIYISDEQNDANDGCLYQVNINQALANPNRFSFFNLDPVVDKHLLYYYNYELSPMQVEITIYNDQNQAIQVENLTTKVGRRGKLNFHFPKGNYRANFKSAKIEENYSFHVIE